METSSSNGGGGGSGGVSPPAAHSSSGRVLRRFPSTTSVDREPEARVLVINTGGTIGMMYCGNVILELERKRLGPCLKVTFD